MKVLQMLLKLLKNDANGFELVIQRITIFIEYGMKLDRWPKKSKYGIILAQIG